MSEFWINKNRWPNDPKGYVFLARALHETGRARFGNDWTGAEFVTEAPLVLSRKVTGELSERARARSLLREHRPDIQLAETTRGTRYTWAKIPVTAEQWAIARKISKGQFDAARPILMRGSTVQAEFVKACEAEELLTAYRPTGGGDMRPIPRSVWNTESYSSRFTMCQLNPTQPFGLASAGDNFAWIFVTRASLDRYLVSQPFEKPLGIEGYLSPYLRVMLAVTRTLEITKDNQPKKEVVIAALREAWTAPFPLSNKLIEAMATLLRDPESQQGRARQKKVGR